jgi:hypothetical protein
MTDSKMSTCRHLRTFDFFQHVVGLVQNITSALPSGNLNPLSLSVPRIEKEHSNEDLGGGAGGINRRDGGAVMR